MEKPQPGMADDSWRLHHSTNPRPPLHSAFPQEHVRLGQDHMQLQQRDQETRISGEGLF